MKSDSISGISIAWIAMALAALALAAYCGLTVVSDQQALSAQIADLHETRELTLELAAVDNLAVLDTKELESSVRELLERAEIANPSNLKIRLSGPIAVPSTALSLTKVRVSLTRVQIPQLVRFLQLREIESPHTSISELSIRVPKANQQKTPEEWAAEVVLTHPGEGR